MRHTANWKRFGRWPMIAACALVFLFAWHAKTAIYKQGPGDKPHTSTASKMWAGKYRAGKVSLRASALAITSPLHYREVSWEPRFLAMPMASGLVPVMIFSGLSPPPQEHR